MEPRSKISEKALKVWRISGFIYSILGWLIIGGLYMLTRFFDWSRWPFVTGIIICAVYTYMMIVALPTLRWKKWRYEVRETEIEIQSGILVVKRTLIPMVRVQHVDTQQGPLLRKYDLATVVISTAATSHEIPALKLSEADELRYYISRQAKVDEEDV